MSHVYESREIESERLKSAYVCPFKGEAGRNHFFSRLPIIVKISHCAWNGRLGTFSNELLRKIPCFGPLRIGDSLPEQMRRQCFVHLLAEFVFP